MLRKLLCLEFELVRQALWTDPGDQSGWLYHRWLIGSGEPPCDPQCRAQLRHLDPPETMLRREIDSIRELHETEPNSKCLLHILD